MGCSASIRRKFCKKYFWQLMRKLRFLRVSRSRVYSKFLNICGCKDFVNEMRGDILTHDLFPVWFSLTLWALRSSWTKVFIFFCCIQSQIENFGKVQYLESKFYLFTNWCTSELSYKTVLKFKLKQIRHISVQLQHYIYIYICIYKHNYVINPLAPEFSFKF